MPQKPKIALSDSTKNTLSSLKKNPNQTFESVVTSLISSAISPKTSQQNIGSAAVAGIGSGQEAFNSYTHTMAWIRDTMKKMPAGGDYEVTPEMREKAYDIEPLVNGIIFPFMSNILFGDYKIITKDNKKFEACIKDQKKFIKDILLMELFKEGFLDEMKHGHAYYRKDPGYGDPLERLQRLEVRAMRTYYDPIHSDIIAYHQRIFAEDRWSSNVSKSMIQTNSWWIPSGLKIIQSENIEADGAREIWDAYRLKYMIDEITNLRVGDSADIIAMHKVRPGKPAPIDAAIQSIWEKRTLIANIPNIIYSVIYPFIHNKKGIIVETVDQAGNKIIITSVPQKPAAEMATTDPEKYANMNSLYNNYIDAMKNDADNLMRYRAEGGVIVTGPDTDIKVIESASSIATGFIDTTIRAFDNDIGMAFGFPTAMILARGAELATSDTIRKLFNTVYAGTQQESNRIANTLIEERFAEQSWEYSITLKDGTKEIGTYTFEETESEFRLSTGDVEDQLVTAQTELATLQGMQIMKALGASKQDIQALLDERGFGIVDLNEFGVQPQQKTLGQMGGQQQQDQSMPFGVVQSDIMSFNENHDENGRFASGGTSINSLHPAKVSEFNTAKNQLPDSRKGYLSDYTEEDIKKNGIKLYLSENKKTGYGLKGDEIINVFSVEKGMGATAINEAIENGGSKLDCFDKLPNETKGLPDYYAKFGFKEYKREKNWTPGEPDVVYMSLDTENTKPTILLSYNENHDELGRFAEGSSSSGGAQPASDAIKKKIVLDYNNLLSKNTNKSSLVEFYQEKANRGETTKAEFKQVNGYTPERQVIHDTIKSQILSEGTSSESPEIVFIGGASASGKGQLINYVDNNGKNHVYINNDEIKKKLPEYRGESSVILHDEARDITDSVLTKAFESKKNIVFDSTLRNVEKSKQLFEVARESGYTVKLISTNIPLKEAATRAADRYMLPGKEGRYVPIQHMVAEHDKTNAVQFELIKYADKGMILDTNVPRGNKYKVIKSKG